MMNKKKVLIFICLVVLVGMLSVNVFAAPNLLDTAFKPLGGLNVAKTYNNYWQIIDTLLYLLFFMGVVQFALEKQFEGRAGKTIIIVFGIMLAIGITIWTSKIGFKLGERLGPIAGSVFAILFFIFLVRLFRGKSEEGFIGPSWWLALGAAYIFINMIFPELLSQLEKSEWGAFAVAIFNFLFLIALFYGIPTWFSKHFRGEGDEGTGDGGGGGGGGGGGRGFLGNLANLVSFRAKNRAKRELARQQKIIREITELTNRINARFGLINQICNTGRIAPNNAFRFLNGAPLFAPLTPAQQNYLNSNRTHLIDLHTRLVADWDALYARFDEILSLNDALRSRALAALGRRI